MPLSSKPTLLKRVLPRPSPVWFGFGCGKRRLVSAGKWSTRHRDFPSINQSKWRTVVASQWRSTEMTSVADWNNSRFVKDKITTTFQRSIFMLLWFSSGKMGLGYKLGICFYVKNHFDYQEMFTLVQKKTSRNVESDDFRPQLGEGNSNNMVSLGELLSVPFTLFYIRMVSETTFWLRNVNYFRHPIKHGTNS